ncbi:MAG TPA: hypothetical protein VF228_06205, partial [Iamia sp.]
MLRPHGPSDGPASSGRTGPLDAVARAEAFVAAGRPDDAARAADEADRALPGAAAPEAIRARITHVRAQCHLLWGDLDAALVLHVLRLREATVAGDERDTAVAL